MELVDRRAAVVALLIAVLALPACGVRPSPQTLFDSSTCASLLAGTEAHLRTVVAGAAGGPLEDAFLVSRRRPPRVAEAYEGLISAEIRAEQICTDGTDAFDRRVGETLEDLRRSERHVPAQLLVAQLSDEDDALRQLRRAVVIADELQRSFHHAYGTYAISDDELRAQAPEAADRYARNARIEVFRASVSRYCAEVSVRGLPTLTVEGPGREVTARGCPRR